jgi:predicted AlkP superfamily pyrophosphatase or phosphodiesterase
MRGTVYTAAIATLLCGCLSSAERGGEVGLMPVITAMGGVAAPAGANGARGSVLATPRLIVLIVFDQLRADHLVRFAPRFQPASEARGERGGFRYLMEHGAWYPYMEHRLLQAMTCPGHATISTGAYPYRHGIVLNGWSDVTTGESVYCLGDSSASLVGVTDPKNDYGVSLLNLRGPTLADALAFGGQDARVVGVSLKDRAALLMAGHDPEAAIWFVEKENRWVTTSALAAELPAWVVALNEGLAKRKGEELVFPIDGPGVGLSDPLPSGFRWTTTVGGKGAVKTPWGNELVTDAAIAALSGEDMGSDDHVDLLAVSYSTLDKVGHSVGPNARLFEETMVDSDRSLARLLGAIDRKVGLEHVVVAVTGDHGVAPLAKWSTDHGLNAVRFRERDLEAGLEAALTEKFGAAGDGLEWVVAFSRFNVYLNPAAAKARGVRLADVRRFTAAHFASMEGIAHAFTQEDVAARTLPPGRYEVQILRQYMAGRSGDVVVIPAPFYFSGEAPANHVSGYTYDTHVPLLLGGFGIRPGVYPEGAETVDIAPTLSFLARVLPPALSEGRVLQECLQH